MCYKLFIAVTCHVTGILQKCLIQEIWLSFTFFFIPNEKETGNVLLSLYASSFVSNNQSEAGIHQTVNVLPQFMYKKNLVQSGKSWQLKEIVKKCYPSACILLPVCLTVCLLFFVRLLQPENALNLCMNPEHKFQMFLKVLRQSAK